MITRYIFSDSDSTILLPRTYGVWCEGNVFTKGVLLFTGMGGGG